MFVFFRNGTSVWFHAAKKVQQEKEVLQPMTARGRIIAEIPMAHVAFWCYDNEQMTTYGFAEREDKTA